MIIAQITDTHIRDGGVRAYGRVDTVAHLADAVAAIAGLAPPADAVIVTGDLVDAPTADAYDRFRALVAPLAMPVLPLPGNHDGTAAFAHAFADRGVPDPARRDGDLAYAAEIGALRLVMLDSTVPGAPHGLMTDDRLRRLDALLAGAPARPTIVALHHPPFATGIRHMDAMNCRNGGALEAVLARHPQVLATVAGHVHRSIATTFAGRAASIAPSPAHAVSLALAPDAPATFHMEPPGLHLHVWDPDGGPFGRLVTHLVPIGLYPGPHAFAAATD